MQEFIKENKGLMKWSFTFLTLLLLSLTIYTVVGVMNQYKEGRYIGEDVPTRNTITVSGEGEVFTKPDLAIIQFTVLSEAKTVKEVTKDNNSLMNSVISKIKEEGVEEDDLKTKNYSINPRYEWLDESELLEVFPRPGGKRTLVGYEVRQTLEVKIRDMEKIGDIIEMATMSGVNQMGNISFSVENEDEFKNEARKKAIEKAKAKAKTLAKQLDVKLIKIINFHENQSSYPYYADRTEFAKALGMGGGEVPNIQTGKNSIKVNVNITYEID